MQYKSIFTHTFILKIEENTRLLAKKELSTPTVILENPAADQNVTHASPVKVSHLKQPQNARTAMLNWAQETVTAYVSYLLLTRIM